MTNLQRRLVSGALGAAAVLAAVAPGLATPSSVGVHPGEGYAQYYGGRGSYRRGYGGGDVAAGVIGGLAAGALVGGAIAGSQAGPGYPGAPVGNIYGADPEFVNYCARRYRSFDPRDGTYLASDGYRYPCR